MSNEFPVIPDSEFAARMDAFKAKMAGEGLDLVVAFGNMLDPSPVRYFADFWALNESAAVVIPLEGDPILCSGQACQFWAEYKSKIKERRILPEIGEVGGVEYEVGEQFSFAQLFGDLKNQYQVKRVGYIGTLTFPMIIFEQLKNTFPSAEIVNADRLMYDLRVKKSPNEVACMRRAASLLDRGFEKVLETIQPGMTELDIEAIITAEILRGGGETTAIAWTPMIPSGPERSKLCMNRNSLRQVQEGEIICLQSGATYEGYNASLCYPLVLGEVPSYIRDAVQVASDAVDAVIEKLRPGATSREVSEAGRRILREHGYLKYSPYGLIHAIGMMECELPWLSAERDDPITEGLTVCTDMFLFRMDWGSFRIEDTIVVNKDGAEKLTTFNDKHLGRILGD